MSRSPVTPLEKRNWIATSVLVGEVSVAEAARSEKVSAQLIGNWIWAFVSDSVGTLEFIMLAKG